MCRSPVSIVNPNYGLKGRFSQFKDTVSARIMVPCGVCDQCIQHRQLQFVQRLQMEEIANHLFFCTLTYNSSCLPIVGTSTGYSIRYADVSDVQNMVKRIRKRNLFGRPFRYFGVTELGSKRGRPHFHILFIVPKYEGDTYVDCLNLEKVLFDAVLSEWKRNVTDKFIEFRGKTVRDWRHPVWEPLCTYVRKSVNGRIRTNYDLHYVNPGLSSGGFSDVAFYVVKYMLKPSDRALSLQRALALNLPSEEYEDIWSLVRPRHFESEALGLGCSEYVQDGMHRRYTVHPDVYAHLRRSIDASKRLPDEPIPSVIGRDDGKFRPLARYYKSRPEVFTLDDFFDFYYGSKKSRPDNVVIDERYEYSQDIKAMDEFDTKKEDVFYRQSADELDDLFDSDGFVSLLQ